MIQKCRLMRSDIREKKNAYLLEVELPGCKKEDISLYTEKEYLYIAAKIQEIPSNDDVEQRSSRKYLLRERLVGDYQRSYRLGDDLNLESMEAIYTNGLLQVTIPKKTKQEVLERGKICIQ